MKEQEPAKALNVRLTVLSDGIKDYEVLIFKSSGDSGKTLAVIHKKELYEIADLAKVTGVDPRKLSDRIRNLSPHKNDFNIRQSPSNHRFLFEESDFLKLAEHFLKKEKVEKPNLPSEEEILTLPDGLIMAVKPSLLTTKLAKAVLALHHKGEDFTLPALEEFLPPEERCGKRSLAVALGQIKSMFEKNTAWTIVNLTSRHDYLRNHRRPVYVLKKMSPQELQGKVEQPASQTQATEDAKLEEASRELHQETIDPRLLAVRIAREPNFNEVEEMRMILKLQVTESLLDFYERGVDRESGKYKDNRSLDVYVFIESVLEDCSLDPSCLTFLTDKWFNQNEEDEEKRKENRTKLKNALLKLFEEGLENRLSNIKLEPYPYYDENARLKNREILAEAGKFLV